MSAAGGPSLPDFTSLERGQFHYIPVVPGRMEFAIEVRTRLLAERPSGSAARV